MNYGLLIVNQDVSLEDPVTEELVHYLAGDEILEKTWVKPGYGEWPAQNPVGVLYVVPGNFFTQWSTLISKKERARLIYDYYKKR